MPQTLQATTADVLIAFQTRPGVDSSSIIKAGEASIKGTTTKIKPQGKGYYGFKIQPGKTAVMKLFNTEYTIAYQDKDELETADPKVLAITNWKVTGDKAKRQGTQRRLQMLGYYNGRVDKKMGKGSEFAVLNFQADNKLRTDGEIGAKTRKKLDDVIDKKNKTGEVYISRRAMIRFDWLPHSKKLDREWGWPRKSRPLIDDRGTLKVKSHGIKLYGPVVCVQRKTTFKVKVIRECIDKDATLVATSDDTSLVEVKSTTPLPKGERFPLVLEAKDPGRKPKATSIKIKYREGDKDIEIGSLQVIVEPLKVVKVRIYYCTIKDSTGVGLTCAGTLAGSTEERNVKKVAKLKKDFRMIKYLSRNFLRSYGIYLKFMSDREKTVTLSSPGTISKVGGNLRSEFGKALKAKDSAGRDPSKKEINILVVSDTEGCLGICFPACYHKWPNGIAFLRGAEPVLEPAKTMAHEIGHYLALANLTNKKKIYAHVDDDPSAKNKKKDLWTVSKLMFAYMNHSRPINPGFGWKKLGGKLSIRNLPSDPTDDEVATANKWARNKKFYCNP